MAAIMIGLHAPCGIVRIDVICVEVSADLVDRVEVLDHGGACGQDLVLEADGLSGNFCI